MSSVCERCGKSFDEDFDRDTFEMETLKNYNYLTKCLCAECAIDAIEAMEDDIYFEVCCKCGKEFNPFSDELELQRITGDDGATIEMTGDYLCLDCSIDAYNENA